MAAAAISRDSLQNDIAPRIQTFAAKITTYEQQVNFLGTAKDNESLRRKLKTLRDETKALSTTIGGLMRGKPQAPADQPLYTRLGTQFKECLAKYEAVNRDALRKEREHVAKADPAGTPAAPVGRHRNDDQFGGAAGSDGRGGAAQFSQQQKYDMDLSRGTAVTAYQLEAEMNKDVREIERDLKDLQQVYVDFSQMVQEQQSDIDQTEKHVESAVQSTQKANTELGKAREYQIAARKKMCMIIMILVVVVGVAIGVPLALKSA